MMTCEVLRTARGKVNRWIDKRKLEVIPESVNTACWAIFPKKRFFATEARLTLTE